MHGTLGAHTLVVRDRETMCLVADALHEVHALRVARQDDRVRAVRQEELLSLLRERDDRDLQAAGIGERVEAR